MTLPGGGDRIVRYTAVGNFASLIRDAKLAKRALQDLQDVQSARGDTGIAAEVKAAQALKKRTDATVDATKATKADTDALDKHDQELGGLSKHFVEIARHINAGAKAQRDATKATDEFGRSTARGERETSKFGTGVQRSSSRTRMLITAIIALGSAAIPVLGVVGGQAIALGAAFGVALAGVGAFAIAAVGQVKAISDQMKASGGVLTGEFAGVGNALAGLHDTWQGFLKDTRGDVFGAFSKALGLAGSLLEKLAPLVNVVARAIGNAVDEVAAFTESADFSELLDFFKAEAPRAIRSFTRIILNLVSALGGIMQAFAPMARGVLDGLERITASFAKWAHGLSSNEGFQKFVAFVRENGPKVWAALGDIAKAAMDLIAALAPVGVAVLALIQAFAKFIQVLPTKALSALVAIIVTLMIVTKVAAAFTFLRGVFVKVIGTVSVATGTMGAHVVALRTVGVASYFAAVGTRVFTVALKALTAATVVGIALLAVSEIMDAFTGANKNSIVATEVNTAAIDSMNTALKDSSGLFSGLVLLKAQDVLATTNVAGSAVSLAAALDQLGVSGERASRGLLGSKGDAKATMDALDKKIADARAAFDNASGLDELKQAGINLKDTVEIRDAYKVQVQGAHDARIEADVLAVATGNVSDQLRSQVKGLNETGNRWKLYNQELSEGQQAMAKGKALIADATSADKAWADAKQHQTDTAKSNTRATRDAAKGVVDAERSVAAAHRTSLKAQKDLTQARKDAIKNIEDLRRRLKGLADDDKSAQIRLIEARRAQADAQLAPGAVLSLAETLRRQKEDQTIGQEKAAIDVRSAEEEVASVQRDQVQTQLELNDATARGVEGAQAVIDAKQAVVDATYAETQAHTDYADAVQHVTDVYEQNIRNTNDAAAATEAARLKMVDAHAELNRFTADMNITVGQIGAVNAALGTVEGVWRAYVVAEGVDEATAATQGPVIMAQAARYMSEPPYYSAQDAVAMAAQDLNKGWQAISRGIMGGLARVASNFSNWGKAEGGLAEGYIQGPGGPKEDKAGLFLLSNKEFVQPADATEFYGVEFMELIRKKKLPKMLHRELLDKARGLAEGGFAGESTMTVDVSNLARFASAFDERLAAARQFYQKKREAGLAGSFWTRRGATGGLASRLAPADFVTGLNASVALPAMASAPGLLPSVARMLPSGGPGGGLSVHGDITVHNPVREPSERSLRRKLQHIAIMGR